MTHLQSRFGLTNSRFRDHYVIYVAHRSSSQQRHLSLEINLFRPFVSGLHTDESNLKFHSWERKSFWDQIQHQIHTFKLHTSLLRLNSILSLTWNLILQDVLCEISNLWNSMIYLLYIFVLVDLKKPEKVPLTDFYRFERTNVPPQMSQPYRQSTNMLDNSLCEQSHSNELSPIIFVTQILNNFLCAHAIAFDVKTEKNSCAYWIIC